MRTQELIIGRKKLTGCPIIGVSQSGDPIGDIGCPKVGTTEVIEKGNEVFREQSYRSEALEYRRFPKNWRVTLGKI